MDKSGAITVKKVENFKNNIEQYNEYLVESQLDMMLIYDGNPYCHEYSLNCKLHSKSRELLRALGEYERALREYQEWINK